MTRTWDHPELGAFEWDIDHWKGRIEVPAWSVYKHYNEEEDEDVENESSVEVMIHRIEDEDEPSEVQVQSLVEFIKHSPKLADAVIEVIWAGFQGKSPTGYWWELDEVNEYAEFDEEAKPIKSKGDVRHSLTLISVSVGYQHESAVEVSFSAWWEDEHGIGVLVHEDRVIGVGYQLSVEPFDKDEPSWPKRGR